MKPVIVSVRAIITAGHAIAPFMEPIFGLHADILIEIVGSAEESAEIDRIVAKRQNRAIRLRNLYGSLRRQIAISSEEIPSRRVVLVETS